MILNVGIIGAGMAFEKLHYPAYQELSDKYRIAALCDLEEEKARYWANILQLGPENVYTDYREMTGRRDIDVFDIMVPIPFNFDVTEQVANRISGSGKGIISEKPTAASLEGAQAHRELPSKYNVPIMIAENYRYNEETNIIRDLVRNNKVGTPYYFIYNRILDFPREMYEDKFPAKKWRQYPGYPGGAFFDSGVHDLAAIRHIFGPVDRLHAFGRPHNADYSPYAAYNVNLSFHSGLVGHFSFFCAGGEAQKPQIGLRIFGSEGMIYLENRNCGVINVAYNDGSREEIPFRPYRGFVNELLNIYNHLVSNEPLFVTPEICYGDTKTVLDALRSIEEGIVVEVDEKETAEKAFAETTTAADPGNRMYPSEKNNPDIWG